jgi:D-glycero-alpha-D-manno-heptose 1-phosphate guanylyltransferase
MKHAHICAAILAGGLGTRLRSVVSQVPKVLAPVGGRPFLQRLLRQLCEAGVDQVVLCSGYLADTLEQAIGSGFGAMQVRYSREQEPLGTGGALRLALDALPRETILVMNGDSFCDTDLLKFIEWHAERKAAASIVLAHLPDTARFGCVAADEAGRVCSFTEKGQSGPGWINAGIYLIRRDLVGEIPLGRAVSIEREVFPQWAACGGLYAYQAEVRRFVDIGTPESLLEAQKLLAD